MDILSREPGVEKSTSQGGGLQSRELGATTEDANTEGESCLSQLQTPATEASDDPWEGYSHSERRERERMMAQIEIAFAFATSMYQVAAIRERVVGEEQAIISQLVHRSEQHAA